MSRTRVYFLGVRGIGCTWKNWLCYKNTIVASEPLQQKFLAPLVDAIAKLTLTDCKIHNNIMRFYARTTFPLYYIAIVYSTESRGRERTTCSFDHYKYKYTFFFPVVNRLSKNIYGDCC